MRRIFKGLLATAVVVFLTGYGISKSMNNNAQLSATTLANIEAISQDENGGGSPHCIGEHFKVEPRTYGWECINDMGNSCCPIPF